MNYNLFTSFAINEYKKTQEIDKTQKIIYLNCKYLRHSKWIRGFIMK